MKEGWNADDAWIMVEDEFLDTAKLFTQHLHFAEYKRLKHQVIAQNERKIHDISHGTSVSNGELSGQTKAKRALEARARAQNAAYGESDNEEDGPFPRGSHLAGLMTGSQEPDLDLSGFAAARPKVKAKEKPTAASKPAHATQRISDAREDDVDKLIAPARSMPQTTAKAHRTVTQRIVPNDANTTSSRTMAHKKPPDKRPLTERLGGTSPVLGSNSLKAKKPLVSVSSSAYSANKIEEPLQQSSKTSTVHYYDAKSPPKPRTMPAAIAERIAKRKAEKVQREQAESQKRIPRKDEIPTFLF